MAKGPAADASELGIGNWELGKIFEFRFACQVILILTTENTEREYWLEIRD